MLAWIFLHMAFCRWYWIVQNACSQFYTVYYIVIHTATLIIVLQTLTVQCWIYSILLVWCIQVLHVHNYILIRDNSFSSKFFSTHTDTKSAWMGKYLLYMSSYTFKISWNLWFYLFSAHPILGEKLFLFCCCCYWLRMVTNRNQNADQKLTETYATYRLVRRLNSNI